MSLGETLKRLREERGETLRDVAKATGKSSGHLSLLECGRVPGPDPRTLHTLATYYQYPYVELLKLAGHPVESLLPGVATMPLSDAIRPELESLQVAEQFRDQQIEQRAKELLASCGISEPPTDPLRILSHLSLELFSLEHFTFVRPLTKQVSLGGMRKIFQRVNRLKSEAVAILDRRNKRVYVNPVLDWPSRNQAILHEVAHNVIAWHTELIALCLQSDLRPVVHRTLEMEANLFSYECIFQGERFAKEAVGYDNINISIIELLATRYGASFEATAWRYVENHYLPCAMLFSVPIGQEFSGRRSLEVKYYRKSAKFRASIPHRFIPENPIVKWFYEGAQPQPFQYQFKLPLPEKESNNRLKKILTQRPKLCVDTESVATSQYVLTLLREKGIEW